MVIWAFDLKGTIITGSEEARAAALNKYLEENGYRKRFTAEQIEEAGYGWPARVRRLVPGLDSGNGTVGRLNVLQRELMPVYVRQMEGTDSVLREIENRGDRSVLVSTSSHELIGKYLQAAGINEGLFERKYSVLDDTGADSETLVPDKVPELKAVLFKRIKERFGGRIIAVGDKVGDVVAANEAGIEGLLISRKVLHIGHAVGSLREALELVYSGRDETLRKHPHRLALYTT